MIGPDEAAYVVSELEHGARVTAETHQALSALVRDGLLGKGLSVKDLCERYGQSANGLGHQFRRAGLPSPSRVLRLAGSLGTIAYMMKRDVTVDTAACAYGWSSGFAFWRWCRRELGLSPTEIREKLRGNGDVVGLVLDRWNPNRR